MTGLFKAKSRDGTVISSQKSGSGPPLLMVHGAAADHESWSGVSPQLAQHFTVYAMDRRGRGESGDAPDYDLQREAEDVAAVVDAMGEPSFVFGHSFGGLCVLEGALLTDNISRLILYEPAVPTAEPEFPPGTVERIQSLVDRGELEAAMEMTLRDAAHLTEQELADYRRSPLWKKRIPLAPTIPREMAVDAAYTFDPERFAGLQISTLLLLGGDSPAIYRQGVELVDSALPNSKVVLMPGQTHLAHYSSPQLFVREIQRFLLD